MKVIKLLALYIFTLLGFLLISPSAVFAQTESKNTTDIIVFVRNDCLHCQDEEKFLEQMTRNDDKVAVKYYRLENQEEREVWDKFTSRLELSKITPITVIGDRYLIGYSDAELSGREIKKLVDEAIKRNISTDINNTNLREAGQKRSVCPDDDSKPCLDQSKSYDISLPFVGTIDTQKYPLMFLSALLGFFDGFNPCAMWVLITFLVILIEVGDRKKMCIFAGIFILAEALMYSLILTIWYKTWDFVKLDNLVTPIVGTVSIIGGIFFLNEWRKKEIECKVTNMEHRSNTHKKIKNLATDRFTVLTFLGILGIAFSVNIIEFACSIGIPQAFTKILELNRLAPLQTIFFIFVYIFFYMLDDFLVFALALYGADKLHLTTRYSKLSNLAGGIVMIILGLILAFKSHLLFF